MYIHGPDGLWAASLVSAISYVWSADQQKLRYIWCSAAVAVMVAFEVCQFYGVITGTGDRADSIAYLVFSLPILVLRPKIIRKIK